MKGLLTPSRFSWSDVSGMRLVFTPTNSLDRHPHYPLAALHCHVTNLLPPITLDDNLPYLSAVIFYTDTDTDVANVRVLVSSSFNGS